MMPGMGTAGGTRRISPLFNDAFLRIFGQADGKELVRSLVNALLREVGIDEVGELLEVEAEHTSTGGQVDCRDARFDIRLIAANRIIDIESERRRAHLIAERSLFYASHLICEGTGKGAELDDMPQALVITLLDTPPLFPEEGGYIARTRIEWDYNPGRYPCTDRMVFILVELSKFRARYTELDAEVLGNELLSWLYLITNGYRNEEEVRRIVDAFPTLEEFSERYGIAMDDPQIKIAYRDYHSAVMERNREASYYRKMLREGLEKGRAEAIAEGMAEGRAKGIAEGRAELLERLRALGVDESLLLAAVEECERERDGA